MGERPRETLLQILTIGGFVLGFFVVKQLTLAGARDAAWFVPITVAGGLGLAGVQFRYRDAPRAYTICLRTIVTVFLFYTAVQDTGRLMAALSGGRSFHWSVLHVVGLAGGAIALFRPSFAVLLLTYSALEKAMLADVSGIPITRTDYGVVLEFGVLLSVAGVLYTWGQRLAGRIAAPTSPEALHPLECAVLAGAAAHLANYFLSGYQKLQIGDGWLDWVLQNRTHLLMLAAERVGALPISISAALTRWSMAILPSLDMPLNALVLGSQLFAILAMWRMGWIVAITLIYDVTHLGIFLLSGIFFWKWVLLNLAIVAAVGSMRGKAVRPAVRLALILLLISAEHVFFVVRLAWFDTASFNDSHVVAMTADGHAYRVPSNYFGPFSVTVAQQRFGGPRRGGFATGSYGATRDLRAMQAANRCALPATPTETVSGGETDGHLHVARFLRRYHQYVLARTDTTGVFAYDLFPHHIWSMPWDWTSFHALDKRTIVGYRVVLEAVCFPLDGAGAEARVMHRESYDVPL